MWRLLARLRQWLPLRFRLVVDVAGLLVALLRVRVFCLRAVSVGAQAFGLRVRMVCACGWVGFTVDWVGLIDVDAGGENQGVGLSQIVLRKVARSLSGCDLARSV